MFFAIFFLHSFAGRDSAEQTINYRLREGRTAVVYKVNNRGTIPYKTKSMNPAPVEICIYTNLLRRCRPVSSCPLHLRGGVTDSHPIGHSKKMQKTNFAIFFSSFLCRKGESNPRPTDYESVALPTVPFRLVNLL